MDLMELLRKQVAHRHKYQPEIYGLYPIEHLGKVDKLTRQFYRFMERLLADEDVYGFGSKNDAAS